MHNIVKVSKLSFSNGHKVIFDNVDLNIQSGKITAIMGPSGSGKTTLLKLISGLLYPDQGLVEYKGLNIHTLPRSELFSLRKNMSMLFQSGALFTDLNVFDNVAYPIREHANLSEDLVTILVLMKLNAVGLRGAAYLYPDQLSGGMARRVAFARAIALDPEFIMYDEPFTGQDPINKGVLVKLIKSLNSAMKISSVLVSHDVPETLSIADYVYVIADGKVVIEGTPDELQNSDLPKLKQFLRGLPDGPVKYHYPTVDFREQLCTII